MLEPIALPTAMVGEPCSDAVAEVNISGAEVPKATIVAR